MISLIAQRHKEHPFLTSEGFRLLKLSGSPPGSGAWQSTEKPQKAT
ncbi:hypothetical protein [Paenibacillus sp. FSL R5-0912]|nr:hypothetical protein [Paenibacillus sp. FSL R5-0912]